MEFLQMIAQPQLPPAVMAGMGGGQSSLSSSQGSSAAPSIFDAILRRGDGKEDVPPFTPKEEKDGKALQKDEKGGPDLFLLMAMMQTVPQLPPQGKSVPSAGTEEGKKQISAPAPEPGAARGTGPGMTGGASVLPQASPVDMPVVAAARGTKVALEGGDRVEEMKGDESAPVTPKLSQPVSREGAQQKAESTPEPVPVATGLPEKPGLEMLSLAGVKADIAEKGVQSGDGKRVNAAERTDVPAQMKTVSDRKEPPVLVAGKGEALPGVNPGGKSPERGVAGQAEEARPEASNMREKGSSPAFGNEKGKGGEAETGNGKKGDNGFAGNMMTAAAPPQESVKGGERAQALEKTPRLNREEILSQVREGLERHGGKGDGLVSIRLHPEELGELHLNIKVEAQQVKVEVVASHKMVKDLLMDNLDSLKETLQKQRLNMESFDVSTNTGNGSGRRFSEGREPGQPSGYAAPKGIEAAEPSMATAEKWERREDALVDVRL